MKKMKSMLVKRLTLTIADLVKQDPEHILFC
jgi:hypothetical protein